MTYRQTRNVGGTPGSPSAAPEVTTTRQVGAVRNPHRRSIPDLVRQMLIAFILFGVLMAASVNAAASADSADGRLRRRPQRTPVDYILAVPSFALKLPFRALGYIFEGPVKLIERKALLSTIQSVFAFGKPLGLRPVAGFKSRTGLFGGLKFKAGDTFGSEIPISTKATVSTEQYRYLALRLGQPRMWSDRYGFRGEIGWRASTREPLYGIGPSSSVGNEVNYGYRGGFGGVRALWQALRQLEVEGFASYRKVKPENGRDRTVPHDLMVIDTDTSSALAGEDLFGLLTPLDLYEVGLALRLDWRKRPGSPLGGGTELLRVSYVSGDAPGDTSIGFWRIRAEAMQYINIFGGRVLGLGVKAQHTEADEGTRVPFYERSRLGGSRVLRGYKTGRFTDMDMVVFTAEYRWPLWRHIDAVLFTDQGRVFADLQKDFEFSNFRSTYGGELRFWSGDSYAGLALAKGNEPLRLYFSAGEAF